MTDTVNVPREATLGMLEAAERVGSALAGSDASSGEMIAAVWSALLAAAPKADDNALSSKPVADKISHDTGVKPEAPKAEADYRKLVRDVDRMHEDGAIPPEAPKVEQEPWDYAVRYRDYGWGLASDLPEDERDLVLRGIPFWEVKPLYTHPAPASEELLEAAEALSEILEAILQFAHTSYGARLTLDSKAQSKRDRAVAAIAKHKGPQS